MKIIIIVLFMCLSLLPFNVLADGYAVFPEASLQDLKIVSLDPETSSFVMKNERGEYVKGYTNDFLGSDNARVIEITDRYVTIESIEIIIDKDGTQHEQPYRMQLPLSLPSHGVGKSSH